jgi:hypothetical protein
MSVNDVSRRSVLLYGSALPFLARCDDTTFEVSAASPAPSQVDFAKDPEWLKAAFRRMKESGRWGLILVAPDGKDDRIGLGRSLYDLAEFEDDAPSGRELLAQVVLITVTAAHATARFPTPGAKANRILLSPEGALLAADAVSLDVYKTSASFTSAFKDFIYGPAHERLKVRAQEMAIGFSEEQRQSAAKLQSTDLDERVAGAIGLTKHVESMAPYLGFLAELGATEEGRREARLLLRRYHGTLKPETPGARLPYGCTLGKFTTSCGWYVPEDQEVTIACGMARVIRRTGKFISFVAR